MDELLKELQEIWDFIDGVPESDCTPESEPESLAEEVWRLDSAITTILGLVEKAKLHVKEMVEA